MDSILCAKEFLKVSSWTKSTEVALQFSTGEDNNFSRKEVYIWNTHGYFCSVKDRWKVVQKLPEKAKTWKQVIKTDCH